MRLTDNSTSRSKSESSDDSCLELRRRHRIFVQSERVPHSYFSKAMALLGALKFVFWCTKAHLPSWQFIPVTYATRESPISIKSYFGSENSHSHQISDDVYHHSLHFVHYALHPNLGGQYHFSSLFILWIFLFKTRPFAASSKGFIFREFSLWEWKFYSCNKSLARFFTLSVGVKGLVFPYSVFICRIFRPYEAAPAAPQRSCKCKGFNRAAL